MKLVYLILAHEHPSQLRRLIQALTADQVAFCIHIDLKNDLSPFIEAVHSLANVHFVDDRISVNWGGFSQTEAILTTMETALSLWPESKRMFLLSGSCYPLATNEKLLSTCDDDEQLIKAKYFSPGTPRAERAGRYAISDHPYLNKRWTHTVRDRADRRVLLELQQYVSSFLDKLPPKPELPMRLHCGATWWGLTTSAVSYVVHYCQDNPPFIDYFRFSQHADESMIHTLIANSTFKIKNGMKAFHYVDWSPESISRKKYLGTDALDRVDFASQLFLRKVHPQLSADLLNKIDQLRHSSEASHTELIDNK